MKHIFLNLKRFDIPRKFGGVNSIAPISKWGEYIISNTQDQLKFYDSNDVEFSMYFPEAHILSAVSAMSEQSPIQIGCQGVFREDTFIGGNFGAFTTNRTAYAMGEMGCSTTIIGHCEEREDKLGILKEAGITGRNASITVNRILNSEIKAAQATGLSVLYCIGEKSEEQNTWRQVLGEELEIGLDGIDKSKVVIAYEPIWSIGPGKTPADAQYLQKLARFIKDVNRSMDVVYGGGIKIDNAEMLASIPEIDGGLIVLREFSGDIGFYPDEFIQIEKKYLGK